MAGRRSGRRSEGEGKGQKERGAKGKHMSTMLTNGTMFSTFKRTDSHSVRCRFTRKDGVVIYERIFRNGSFRKLKMAIELAKVLLESNQKSNQMCYQ